MGQKMMGQVRTVATLAPCRLVGKTWPIVSRVSESSCQTGYQAGCNRLYTLLSVAVDFGGDAGSARAHEGQVAFVAMRPKGTGLRNQVCSILDSFRVGLLR